MSTDQPADEHTTFCLPSSRGVLRAVVVGCLLPLVLIGASTTGSGCCGCSIDSASFSSRGTGAADPYSLSFLGGTAAISFPDPDGSEIVANNARTLITTITPGLPVLFPEGTLTVTGTAAKVAGRGGAPPKKLLMDADHKAAGESAAKVFSTVLKIKNGKIKQTKDQVDGFTAQPGERVRVFLRPRGGAVTNDQTYDLTYNYAPTPAGLAAAMREYGWTALSAIETGRRLLSTVPDGAGALPLLFRANRTIEAKAKQDVVSVVYGVAFETAAFDLAVGAGFFGQGASKSLAPKRVTVFVVIRDAEGNTKLSVTYKLAVQNNNVALVTKAIEALSIEPGDELDIQMKLNGGDVNPGDGVFIFLTATPSP